MNDNDGIGLRNHQGRSVRGITSRDRCHLFGEQLHSGLLPLYRIEHSSGYLGQGFAGGSLHNELYGYFSALPDCMPDNSPYNIRCGKLDSSRILSRLHQLYNDNIALRILIFESPDAFRNSVCQGQEVVCTIGKYLEFSEQDSERYCRVYSGEVIPASENEFRSIFSELLELGGFLIVLSSPLLYGNKNKKSINKEVF